jgi:hypothetical protein
MSAGPRFSLKRLFLWVTLVGLLCGGCVAFANAFREAYLGAERSAYGGRRFTRAEAEAISNRPLVNLPDSEFRDVSAP